MKSQIFMKDFQINEIDSPITYSDNVHSDFYITQFLSIAHAEDDPRVIENQNGEHNGMQMQADDTNSMKSHMSDNRMDKKPKLTLHNFQKHLIRTLRHSVRIEKINFGAETNGLEKRLWNFFINCPRMTRKLVELVFGGMDLQRPETKRIMIEYGMNKILGGQSLFHISESQRNLRFVTLKQSQHFNMDWEMKNRRMKNKTEFRMYFEAFIEQLSGENFNRGIPVEKGKILFHREHEERQALFQANPQKKSEQYDCA